MDALGWAVTISLAGLTATLALLSGLAVLRFSTSRRFPELMWGTGLASAAVATAVELLVYVGLMATALLQTYVFLSAAIVGLLSLGSTRVIGDRRFRLAYTGYTLGMCAVVGFLSYTTPLSSDMVSAGVISGNPPAELLALSSFVTVPATVVLLGAVVIALRRAWRWRTVMMGVGASVLAAGGALYIASFPVALYYAEFIGIVLIFAGLVGLPHPASATDIAKRGVPRAA